MLLTQLSFLTYIFDEAPLKKIKDSLGRTMNALAWDWFTGHSGSRLPDLSRRKEVIVWEALLEILAMRRALFRKLGGVTTHECARVPLHPCLAIFSADDV